MRQRLMTSLGLVPILLLAARVDAVVIPVNNPSFEENVLNCEGGSTCFDEAVPGWTITVSARTATFKPSLGPDKEFISTPDGVNVAALGNEQGGAGIFQTLTAVVEPNTVYTLQVSVGHRADFAFSQYTITLEADETVLASGSSVSPAAGTFLTDTLIFSSGPAPATMGQPLVVRLAATGRTSTGAAGQANFDLVLLEASPQSPTVTPTPEGSEPTGTPTIGQKTCPGDCSGDGVVQVSELLTGVNIALGFGGLDLCGTFDLNGDGAVDVNELVRSVIAALRGCEAPAPFVFAAMGDVPYDAEAAAALPGQLAGIPTDSDFVVHLGDIKPGLVPCEESIYRDVAAILRGSSSPLFIVPGDNEYNDCRDPEEAWELWDTHFRRFDQNFAHDLRVEYQEGRDENFAFVHRGALFIGINLVGAAPFGPPVHDEAEWATRLADDLAWTRHHFEQSGDAVDSVVVFGHAFPTPSHDTYFDGLVELATRLEKPILYLHGDLHFWLRHRPFAAQNIESVMVDEGNLAPPVLVTVTHDPEEAFLFDRRLGAE